MKPYYQDSKGQITLYHGDCLDVMPSLSPGFDMVFTSPPYNMAGSPWPHLGNWKSGDASGSGGKSKWRGGSDAGGGVAYGSCDDDMPHEEYVAWQRSILAQCWGLLSDQGAIFYNHKPRVIGNRLWLPLELNPDLPLRQIVVWARAGGINYSPTAYVPTHEWVMIFAKPAFRLHSRGASGVGDVWRIPQEANPSHPAPFPLSLPLRAIETAGSRLVLDPYAGIGTTLRAAKDCGVRAVGIEIDERYCELAAKRLSQCVIGFADP